MTISESAPVTWPRQVRVILTLRSGVKHMGKWSSVTEAEFEKMKEVMGNIMSTSGGAQVNLETDAGSWVIAPLRSVDFIKVQM